MKPNNPGSRRKKIILYYVMAVVLPGIILGYMAYRGVRNDQALREKESRRKLETDSQAFFNAIDSSLVRFINEQSSDTMFSGSRQGDPSLLLSFVKDSSGPKRLLTHHLLYLPEEFITVQPEKLSPPIKLQEGLRLEYIERNFSEALIFYQDRALHASNPAERIQAMVASARLYNKMNQPDRAKSRYEEIRKDYPGSLLQGLIPLGLVSCLEILKIDQASGNKDDMRKDARQSLELLLRPPCEYDISQFDLFYQSFKDVIREKDPEVDSLFRELDSQRMRTDYLIRILTGLNLVGAGSYNLHKSGENRISSIPIHSSELTAVYLSQDRGNGVQTAMVIDFPVYLKSISANLIHKLDSSSVINLKIEDNNGSHVISRIIQEETSFLSFPFPENLPKWKLLLSENKPGFISTLLKAGSGIYLFIFILIALLMALGFVFIIYTLNTELRLNKLKSEFISNVSHELKSPLTSIRMMTEMLHQNRVPEERKPAYYHEMLEESEHLSHLIDNILDFSRMDDDRKKYDFADLDLSELLVKFLESTRERLADPDFNIRYSCTDQLPTIRADRDAILQVIYNLVDNAVKFSGTSKQIDINLFSRNDELQLCVKDYGIGISSEDQEKIFDRFYRCDEPQRLGIKGSGIGLTIVKKIIEAHKGHLTLESRPGEGSTFCVHLPINIIIEP